MQSQLSPCSPNRRHAMLSLLTIPWCLYYSTYPFNAQLSRRSRVFLATHGREAPVSMWVS